MHFQPFCSFFQRKTRMTTTRLGPQVLNSRIDIFSTFTIKDFMEKYMMAKVSLKIRISKLKTVYYFVLCIRSNFSLIDSDWKVLYLFSPYHGNLRSYAMYYSSVWVLRDARGLNAKSNLISCDTFGINNDIGNIWVLCTLTLDTSYRLDSRYTRDLEQNEPSNFE